MKQSWRLAVAAAGVVGVGLVGFALLGDKAQGQDKGKAPAAPKAAAAAPKATVQTKGTAGLTAGQYFKNVTSSGLKNLTVDDFLAAMGIITDDLGLDCSNCHPGAGTDNFDWVVDIPIKKKARDMVEMVASINKANFNGAATVTCWTCHHGRIRPAQTIALEAVYDTPNKELDDLVTPDRNQPQPQAVFDKFIAAIGGQAKVDAVKSFIATGESIGYAGLGGSAQFNIYAEAPSKRAIVISYPKTTRPSSSWIFTGTTGFVNTPRGYLGSYEYTGAEREGARIEASLAFPTNLKTMFTNLRTGTLEPIGDKDYIVVQGSGAKGVLAKLYFDAQTGLLTRMIRMSPSPVGRMPTQVDYSDYRDVGGVKFPFTYTFLWLDGRYTAKVSNIQVNAKVDSKMFDPPATVR